MLAVAIVAILIRCIYRLLELMGGYDSDLANHELTFVIFDSVMMVIMTGVLTIGHPGIMLGEYWNRATFSFRTKKTAAMEPLRKVYDESSRGSSQVNLNQPEATPLQSFTAYHPGYERVTNA